MFLCDEVSDESVCEFPYPVCACVRSCQGVVCAWSGTSRHKGENRMSGLHCMQLNLFGAMQYHRLVAGNPILDRSEGAFEVLSH